MQKNSSQRYLHGIDVSHWQGTIDWNAVKNDNIDFAYIKATEGRTYKDPMFVTNVRAAQKSGIPVGAYHFARPDNNPTKVNAVDEARHFINTIKDIFNNGFGDIYPVLDLEVPPANNTLGITTNCLLEWVQTFNDYFVKHTKTILMLYTATYFIKEYNNFYCPISGNPLKKMPLWIAMYPQIKGNPQYPPSIGGWADWTVWQYTNKGKVTGIKGNVDLNWAKHSIGDR
jgi:lysozyme